MAETPSTDPKSGAKVPAQTHFPRAPRHRNHGAQKPPPYSHGKAGGYTLGLPKNWRKKILERFLERGGKNIKLNKAARELLADAVWEIACEAEASRTKQKTVDQLFELMNSLYDQLGINEVPNEQSHGKAK